MGEYADYSVDQNHDWFCGRPARRFKKTYTCKHCGKSGLKWRWMEDGWQLFEQERGEHNRCLEHNCRGASVDDFEDVSDA